MSLLPKSIHWCRRYSTKFNSGWDIPRMTGLSQDMNHALRRLRAVLFYQLFEIDSVEKLHDVIKRPVVLRAVVVNFDRVRRAKSRGRLNLALESLEKCLRRGLARRGPPDELDGGGSRKHTVARFPDSSALSRNDPGVLTRIGPGLVGLTVTRRRG